jgi:hypothetical protein
VLEKCGLEFVETKIYFGMDCYRYVIRHSSFVKRHSSNVIRHPSNNDQRTTSCT